MFTAERAIRLVSLCLFFLAGPLEADEPVWGPFARTHDLPERGEARDSHETSLLAGMFESPSPHETELKDPTIDTGVCKGSFSKLVVARAVVVIHVETLGALAYRRSHCDRSRVEIRPENEPLRSIVLLI